MVSAGLKADCHGNREEASSTTGISAISASASGTCLPSQYTQCMTLLSYSLFSHSDVLLLKTHSKHCLFSQQSVRVTFPLSCHTERTSTYQSWHWNLLQAHLKVAQALPFPLLEQGNLDIRDAAVNTLLQEVASLLQLLVKQGSEPLVQQLASNVIPQLTLSPDLQVWLALRPSDAIRSRAQITFSMS